jgi:spore germination protein GerM
MRRFALIVAAAALVTGCGAEATGGRTETAPAGAETAFRSTIYFLVDGRTAPLGVRRELRRVGYEPLARIALEQLLAGPTADERAAGLATAITAGARIRSFRIESRRGGSDAFVDLSGLPPANDADALIKVRVMTQVARSLIGLSDVARVWLRVDGRAWGLWDFEGNVRDDPIDYERLRGFSHICVAKPGTEAVPGDCFTALP